MRVNDGCARPMVTVAMAVYNGERFLRPAIESILAQQFSDFELIVVDDGSSDGSVAIANEMANSDSRIIVLRAAHGGIAAATNLALAHARGAFFAPMDQDDVALPDRLTRSVQYLDANPLVGAVGGAARLIDETGAFIDAGQSSTPSPNPDEELKWSCSLLHPSCMMRTELVRAVGGYRSVLPYAQDYDLFLRLAERSMLANLADTLLHKRRHSRQVTQDKCSRAEQVVAGALAYLSRIARAEGYGDFLDGRGSVAEAGARFIDQYLADNPSPAPDVVHHVSRFLRHSSLSHDGKRAPVSVYLRYLFAASRAGGAREFVRTGYYLSSFHVGSVASRLWTAGRATPGTP